MSDYNSEKNRFVWVDIPVDDLGRACAFYEGVLGCGVHRESIGEMEFGVLDHHEGNGGCLLPRDEVSGTGAGGVLVYLNVDGRIRDAAAKVGELGGKVTTAVHAIGPHGFRAVIEDSEGNTMALHSNTEA